MAKKKAKRITPKLQTTIGDAFPDRDQAIEAAVANLAKAEAAKQKATDSRTTAYDALKEKMRVAGLAEYYCYDARIRVLMTPEDAKVKIKPIRDEDATPFLRS